MSKPNYTDLLSSDKVAVIAPAGYGKTQAICDMVSQLDGRQLILTHTNAGVRVLKKRMEKEGVCSGKYQIDTIASFCQQWCNAYPRTAGIDEALSPQIDTDIYYTQLYEGAAKILSTEWARSVLARSYSGLFVDEYQDCTIEQHSVVEAMVPCFPVRILGDPMQGIFEWNGNLVDMLNIGFPIEEPLTYPWRWHRANRELGSWIEDVRSQLLPTLRGQEVRLDIKPIPSVVQVCPDYRKIGGFFPRRGQRAVFLTSQAPIQAKFARNFSYMFIHQETRECPELHEFGSKLDSTSSFDLARYLIEFAGRCMSKVKDELDSYLNRVEKRSRDFRRIQKHRDVGEILSEVIDATEHVGASALRFMNYVESIDGVRVFRPELWVEAKRVIRYASEKRVSHAEAAIALRSQPFRHEDYDRYNCVSSRTVLAKGLEFDVAIVDLRYDIDARNFYVAISRATRRVVLLTKGKTELALCFKPQ